MFNERLKSLLSEIKQGVPTRILRLFHNQKCQQLQDQKFLVLCNFYYICFPISEQIFFSNKCEVSVKVVHCVNIAGTRFHSFFVMTQRQFQRPYIFFLIKTLKKAIEKFTKPINDNRAVWLLKGLSSPNQLPVLCICSALISVFHLR